jgi:DNA-binding response OmpR family regulator
MAQPTESTILVVEDDPTISAILRIFLEDSGCRIFVAERGDEAIRLAHEVHPDLVTLDLALPDMEGTEVLRQMNSDADLAHVPVIVVTARRYEPRPDENVTAVLQKPFDATELEDTVRRALRWPVEEARGT